MSGWRTLILLVAAFFTLLAMKWAQEVAAQMQRSPAAAPFSEAFHIIAIALIVIIMLIVLVAA